MSDQNSQKDDSIENLRPLDVAELQGRVTDFDLFLDVAGKPVLYARGHYEWSISEIEKLNHDGFSVLFYQKTDDKKVTCLRALRTFPSSNEFEIDEEDHQVMDQILLSYRDWVHAIQVQEEHVGQAVGIAENLVETISSDHRMVLGFRSLSHHDSYSFYHSIRTAAYGAAIAIELGCKDERHLYDIVLGCLLHDIGHIRIDAEILDKKGKLTEREWYEIKQHPRYAIELLKDISLSPVTTEIIMHHHEREDGHGYPHGIQGSELIQEVKIVSFCDVFDALTSPRPYQKQLEFPQAIEFIDKNLSEFIDQKSFEALKNIRNIQKLKTPA